MPETCSVCRRWYEPGQEPDPCIGALPGVLGACCGHGNRDIAYVAFEAGVVLRGFKVEKGTGVYRPPTKGNG